MGDIIVNFTDAIKLDRYRLPSGKLTIKANEEGNFCGVRTAFVGRADARDEADYSFTDGAPKTQLLLESYKRYCEGLKESAYDFLRGAEKDGDPINQSMFNFIDDQLKISNLVIRILDKALATSSVVLPSSVGLK